MIVWHIFHLQEVVVPVDSNHQFLVTVFSKSKTRLTKKGSLLPKKRKFNSTKKHFLHVFAKRLASGYQGHLNHASKLFLTPKNVIALEHRGWLACMFISMQLK